jgi:hypothetical protein
MLAGRESAMADVIVVGGGNAAFAAAGWRICAG